MNKSKRRYLAAPYGIWAAAFIILPLVMVIYYGMTTADGAFTWSNITAVADPVHYRAFANSLLIALASTVICLVISYPLSYILSMRFRNSAGLVIMLFVLPMWINFLLRILALQMILSRTGILNYLLGLLGISPLRIMYSKGAILIGMVYDYIPFMILPIYNALCKIDRDVVEAARDLGADSATTFREIILPLSLPGVISGIVMVFIPSVSEFVVADILGGSKILLFGNVIEQEFNMTSNWNLGSGLSIVLMIFIFLSMAVMRNNSDNEGDNRLW
ncbi:MAG: ABC transporter permease [Eubacterium sp.]|nr:ABC transporter permease [Eubacterium sp.]